MRGMRLPAWPSLCALVLTLFGIVLAWGGILCAAEPPSIMAQRLTQTREQMERAASDLRRLPAWTDEIVLHEMRIQRNCRTGDYRLLDEKQQELDTGTCEYCCERLARLKTAKRLPDHKKTVVLLLHGLGRTWRNSETLAAALRKNPNWEVISLGYASTEAEVADHAKCLASVIAHLDGAKEIHLVAHSLGNIVIRHYWADQTDPAKNLTPDPRIKRIVMVGPPNHGAKLAQEYGRNVLFETVSGESGQQLSSGWAKLEPHLATPTCEFGIIAGGKQNDIGYNLLIDGDDDFLVAVEETKLPGARDFLLLPIAHNMQMRSAAIHEATKNFLLHGYFVTEQARQPIPLRETKQSGTVTITP